MRTERAALHRLRFALLLAMLIACPLAFAAEVGSVQPGSPGLPHPDSSPSVAQVKIDGVALFRVLGVPAFPAGQRAAAVAQRIEALAADPAFKVDDLRTAESDLGTSIMAAEQSVLVVTDDDARLEGVGRKVAAAVYVARIREAVDAWRSARTPQALKSSAIHALAATVVLALAAGFVLWLWRRVRTTLERRFRARIQTVGIQSFQVMRAEDIWVVLQRVIGTASGLTVLALAFAYLNYVLKLFPWTHGAGVELLEYVLEPLRVMGRGLLAELPSIVFLVILFVLTRWLLKIVHLFFRSVGRAEVALGGFEAEWAEPTYKIVRLLVIVFALVVAYPYIPGSDSDAFKGISLFIGLVFSLGSSSIIANILAGYMMTYRRAFRLGDRVKIGDVIGDVSEMRLQVTHVRTSKNEEVIVPNSTILNNEVVNYSTLARGDGVILHTTVGIGYETPWRQVEALLLEAARRTLGLKSEPAPFVRHKLLGEFAITYELNAYCGDAQAMGLLYTELHRNIIDVFNEHGVQIMTPAYEGDPAEPKVVPRDKWFTPPALPAMEDAAVEKSLAVVATPAASALR
jgi:small-conductance mechanosensitive channel